ncbi:MAG: ornithine carbamoyltransferase [Clostridiales bacterium]|jgi:ornithine carbamoyltransferase|nr:ornithine carbamoyltransferase [Clostridiales bacterium]
MTDITDYSPKGVLKNKHLLTLKDYSAEEIYEILLLAAQEKKRYKSGVKNDALKGKILAMIFSKSSTRTRLSFEAGMIQLGGYPMFLNASDMQLGRNEPLSDTARVISRMGIDGIMIRTYDQKDVEELAAYGGVPVINGLTDLYHPCQVLADLLTVYERFGRLRGLKLAYIGDGNNMANSYMIGCAKLGIDVSIVGPKEYAPQKDITDYAKTQGTVTVTEDITRGVSGADVICTDVFFSMGQEKDKSKERLLTPYQVNDELMKKTGKDSTIFLHCLPAHRGEEVTASVIDGKQSFVFDEAENRLHAQKAVMLLLLGQKSISN